MVRMMLLLPTKRALSISFQMNNCALFGNDTRWSLWSVKARVFNQKLITAFVWRTTCKTRALAKFATFSRNVARVAKNTYKTYKWVKKIWKTGKAILAFGGGDNGQQVDLQEIRKMRYQVKRGFLLYCLRFRHRESRNLSWVS